MIADFLMFIALVVGVICTGSFLGGVLDIISTSRRQQALSKKARRGDEWY